MGFGSLSIATSGIRAAQANLAVTGHNLSNSEIPGFSRQRIVQTTAFTRQVGINNAGERMAVGMGTDRLAVQQIRNEFLDFSYRQNVGRLQFYATMVQTGLVVESLIGELHGAYNFQSVINDIWYAIQELTSDPSGVQNRQLLLATATTFINKAQDVYEGLVAYQHNLDQQIRQMVSDINSLVSQISVMNDRIRAVETPGGTNGINAPRENANDYRDERNRLIDRLAEKIPLDIFVAPNGDVQLFTQGHELLASGNQNFMGLRFISDEFSFVEPVFTRSRDILSAHTPPAQFSSFTNYSRPINSANNNDFGALNALLVARGTSPLTAHCHDRLPTFLANASDAAALRQMMADMRDVYTPGVTTETVAAAFTARANALLASTPPTAAELQAHASALADIHNWRAHQWSMAHGFIPSVQANVDRIFGSIVTMLNDAFTGNLRDHNGNLIFTDPPLDRDGNLGIPMFIRNVDAAGQTATPPVDPVWPFPDQNANSVNTVLSIRNAQINRDLLGPNGHNRLAISIVRERGPDDNLVGAADCILLLNALHRVWHDNRGPYAVRVGQMDFSVQDAYQRFTSSIATSIAEANSFVATQQVQVIQADNMRQAVKGVAMDEELNFMLRFQFAFQAAARAVNVIDSMIDTVVNGTGRIGR